MIEGEEMDFGQEPLRALKIMIQAAQKERKDLESDRTMAGRKLAMLILEAQNHGAKLKDIREWTQLSHQRIYTLTRQFLTREEIQAYRERRNDGSSDDGNNQVGA